VSMADLVTACVSQDVMILNMQLVSMADLSLLVCTQISDFEHKIGVNGDLVPACCASVCE